MKPTRLLLALAAILPGMVTAQSPAAAPDARVAQLRDMSLADLLQVDISTGTSKLIYQTPGIAYVLTAPDIARLGARNMHEVLASLPGINVNLVQGLVNSPLVELRGVQSERGGYILFLRDGRPLRLLSNNTMPEVFRLPVHFIERIEVLRGPASAVYGTDALAGAVNIVTKDAPGELGARIGDEDARAGWAGISGRTGTLDWALAASSSRHDVEAVTRSRQRNAVFTQIFDQSYSDISAKAVWGEWRLDLWALNVGKYETGNPANPRGFVDVNTRHRHADLGWSRNFSATTQLKADLFYTYFRGTRFNELIGGRPTNGDNGEERTTGNFTLTESRFDGHRVRVNGGFFRERRGTFLTAPPGTPAPPPAPSFRRATFLTLQDEFAVLQNWELTAGVRMDRYNDVGTIVTPRAGLVWTVNPTLTAKLLHSEGFRAPALAFTNTSATPAEELRNLELALDYRPDERWRAALNLYRYRANNLIVSGGAAMPPVRRDGKGGELEVSFKPDTDLKLDAAVTVLDAKDRDNGARVGYTPRTAMKLVGSWRFLTGWSAQLRTESYRDIIRPPNDPRPPIADIHQAHVTLRHELNRNASAQLAILNLTDRRTYIPVISGANSDDYQLPARNISLQVDLRF